MKKAHELVSCAHIWKLAQTELRCRICQPVESREQFILGHTAAMLKAVKGAKGCTVKRYFQPGRA